MIVGLIGCVVPGMPGPPLSFIGLLILAIAQHFTPPLTSQLVLIMAVLMVVVTILDYIIPVAGAKKYGASKWGIWGSILGMILGLLFFPPLGIIIGAFLGAVVVEMLIGKSGKEALRAGWGTFLGTLLGTILKLTVSFTMTYYYLKALI
ncbi:MAG: DUF456 domain-containing protein [Calditrichaeota bacterium]|nr:DUF456 domain-containing protein [Calditrichota bacterium]